MDWTRSDTIGIANHDCTHCHGLGLRGGRMGETQPCHCVLRNIFRMCYRKFRNLVQQEKRMSRVTLESAGAQCRKTIWSRKDEEYVADFLGVAKRTLDEGEHRVFRFYHLLGADWNLCCDRLGMDKGTFFHEVYRVEKKLGRVMRELQPYALFPVDQYYFGVKVEHKAKVFQMPERTPVEPPPLARIRQDEEATEMAAIEMERLQDEMEWDMDRLWERKAA